jgi:hypothetical protein
MKLIIEIFYFLNIRKKLWLFPIVLLILLLGSLIFISEGTILAPFIYTLF